jgi:hypothetical protein
VKPHHDLAILALTAFLIGGGPWAFAQESQRKTAFGALEDARGEVVQAQALAWLRQAGKTDAATMQKFNAIWSQTERPVLDRLADTFTLGNVAAAVLLAEANNSLAPSPIALPTLLKESKEPAFFRANLALIYACALSNRHVHDESLEALRQIQPEEVVSPSTYLFHRAVSEHALLLKEEATHTINRLLEDCAAPPDRYRIVMALMILDMQTWKDKDLGAVARKMNVSKERLDLSRGGPKTQKIQKEILARLDEIIRELENKAKGGS